MSIIRFEFIPQVTFEVQGIEQNSLYPTGNQPVDTYVRDQLREFQTYPEEMHRAFRHLFTNFRILDYRWNETNNTFSILATPDHIISPQELSLELRKMIPPKIEAEDIRGFIIPRLNNVYVLTEQQVDVTRLPPV